MESRNNQIEGLRGLAMIIIVLYHTFLRFYQIYIGTELDFTKVIGRFGTCMFLIISCYFLVDFKRSNYDFSLLRYLLKKLLRLWPCYAVAITITAVVVHIWPLPERTSTWTDWLLNLVFINGFIETPYIDGAHWYLTTLVSFIIITGIGRKLKLENNPFFYYALIVVYAIFKSLGMGIVPLILGGGGIASFLFSHVLQSFLFKKRESYQGKKLYYGFA